MISRNLFFLCCLIICLLSFRNTLVNADLLGQYCTNDTAYNPNSTIGSTYRTNLNFLLSNLSSHASQTTNNGFYNFTAGRDSSNSVYGLFLCRGDVSNVTCSQCVSTASTEILRRCPDLKTAIIWYVECLLRYSNESMFSRADQNVRITRFSLQNATDPDKFNQIAGGMMYNIASQAAKGGSGKKFAVQEANYSAFQRKIYALGQCTPDLSSDDCETCLTIAIGEIPRFCTKNQGCSDYFPSCFIRYDVYRFYNIVMSPPPAPWPSPILSHRPSPPPSSKGERRSRVQAAIPIVVPLVMLSVVLFMMAVIFLKRRWRKRYNNMVLGATDEAAEILTAESLQFRLSEIQSATNNFSVDNKIGEGGFGCVYKGVLVNGQDIAVKRLSRRSGQGAEEFKNEIVVVAKLQHRNLVRLLGFCLEGEEKLLIYEFVPNKSLNYFLFDPEKQQCLNWSRRYMIIGGIARGLLYLHEDSRLRIVHRDLKTSNILLDGKMIPKIADFGMAKICGIDQSEGNTNRIAGTFGYMAPEYTRWGLFSVKSDVFSFGVVILEIITGRKNSSFYQSDDCQDLLSHVWKQWRCRTPLALLDPTIGDSYVKNEVIQSIHVGLLCVEEDADKRPTMASVVYMLNTNSTTVTLPTPYRPAIFHRNRSDRVAEELDFDQSNTKSAPGSINQASITELCPR